MMMPAMKVVNEPIRVLSNKSVSLRSKFFRMLVAMTQGRIRLVVNLESVDSNPEEM